MKLIMENWNKFLKEAALKAATWQKEFGGNPDDLECIKNLRDQASRPTWETNNTLVACMTRAGYTEIGGGSFRIVFNVPGHPDKVIKVVYDLSPGFSNPLEINKKEAEGGFQTSSPLAVKVFSAADDYLWIISEHVKAIGNWGDLQRFFPVWNKIADKIQFPSREAREQNFEDFFDTLIKKRAPDKESAIRNKVIKLLEKTPEGEKLIEEKEDEAITDDLINNSFFTTIRNFLIQHNLPSWDIRLDNVGYVIRDNKEQFVVLDPGFGLSPGVGYK